jgi:hypothetical protein
MFEPDHGIFLHKGLGLCTLHPLFRIVFSIMGLNVVTWLGVHFIAIRADLHTWNRVFEPAFFLLTGFGPS